MISPARQKLGKRLADFDELMMARDAICPNGAGRPAQKQGAAVIRGTVVLLAASFEAYVEDVYEDAVDLVFANKASTADRKALKDDTSRRLNNANSFKVNQLFFNLGIPWIMQSSGLRWQKFSNASVRKALDDLVAARNKIAHGSAIGVTKPTAVRWRNVVERLATKMDATVADYISDQTGSMPW